MRRVWGITLPAVIAVNYWCHRAHAPTICSTWRRLVRTDTRAGKLVFIAGFGAFAAWFPGHFLTTTAPGSPNPNGPLDG